MQITSKSEEINMWCGKCFTKLKNIIYIRQNINKNWIAEQKWRVKSNINIYIFKLILK